MYSFFFRSTFLIPFILHPTYSSFYPLSTYLPFFFQLLTNHLLIFPSIQPPFNLFFNLCLQFLSLFSTYITFFPILFFLFSLNRNSFLSFYVPLKNEKCFFSKTQVFNIILSEHDLNRHEGLYIPQVSSKSLFIDIIII